MFFRSKTFLFESTHFDFTFLTRPVIFHSFNRSSINPINVCVRLKAVSSPLGANDKNYSDSSGAMAASNSFMTKVKISVLPSRDVIRSPGVDFTHILHKAFTQADPKSAMKTAKSSVFFAHLGSGHIKAARRTLMKLTTGEFKLVTTVLVYFCVPGKISKIIVLLFV